MTDKLTEICDTKRGEVSARKALASLADLTDLEAAKKQAAAEKKDNGGGGWQPPTGPSVGAVSVRVPVWRFA